jgi:hypothetical protein
MGLKNAESSSAARWPIQLRQTLQSLVHHDAARKPSDAIELIDRIKASLVFLDHDLAPGVDSTPIAEHLTATNFAGEIAITSENPFGIERLELMPPRADVAILENRASALSSSSDDGNRNEAGAY